MSACPDVILETHADITTITKQQGTEESTDDPFDIAKHYLAQLMPIQSAHKGPFYCGLLGYFGYDLGSNHKIMIQAYQAQKICQICAWGAIYGA